LITFRNWIETNHECMPLPWFCQIQSGPRTTRIPGAIILSFSQLFTLKFYHCHVQILYFFLHTFMFCLKVLSFCISVIHQFRTFIFLSFLLLLCWVFFLLWLSKTQNSSQMIIDSQKKKFLFFPSSLSLSCFTIENTR
jgi:hypothetical protein